MRQTRQMAGGILYRQQRPHEGPRTHHPTQRHIRRLYQNSRHRVTQQPDHQGQDATRKDNCHLRCQEGCRAAQSTHAEGYGGRGRSGEPAMEDCRCGIQGRAGWRHLPDRTLAHRKDRGLHDTGGQHLLRQFARRILFPRLSAGFGTDTRTD